MSPDVRVGVVIDRTGAREELRFRTPIVGSAKSKGTKINVKSRPRGGGGKDAGGVSNVAGLVDN